ncbi:MAG: glycosyltransferase family 4 protein [Patescibacteria group bacterium]
METKKLLILTQKVDKDDQALGFFHRWLEEFSKNFTHLEVVALGVGQYELPANVHVHSLGKNSDSNSQENATIYGSKIWKRILYVSRFLRLILGLRDGYDVVFVHMNEEYVLLGGIFWRLMGKRVVLWRNHKLGSWRTCLAVWLCSVVCYTSPEAFVAKFKKSVKMPIGIDTAYFKPDDSSAALNSILFLSRIDPVKKVDIFLDSLSFVHHPLQANLVGSPTEKGSIYAKNIAAKAGPLIQNNLLTMHPAVTYAETRDFYRRNAVFVNLTPSGSFDKTIGEAMSTGTLVVCANSAVREVLPPECFVQNIDAESVAKALTYALRIGQGERKDIGLRLRTYIEKEHSLSLLMERLSRLFN